MYRFLVCVSELNNEFWVYRDLYSYRPNWSRNVKEAICLGYYSRSQSKWIINSVAARVRKEFRNITNERAENDVSLIILANGPTREYVNVED